MIRRTSSSSTPLWVETVVLAPVPRAPWSFVVVDAQSVLFKVNLARADMEYIIEEEDGISARIVLRQAGE
eukprot:12467398-Heterocapsa_arctica.AAC.1